MGGITEGVHAKVSVGGDVFGQIAIGNNILQIGAHHGDLVMMAAPGSISSPTLRPLPIRVVPRRPQPFFGRRAEAALLVAAAGAGRPITVDGPRGIGRSTLLKYVATHDNMQSVAYLSARDLTLDDAVQVLFDTFYHCDVPIRPTRAQAKFLLQQVRASIVVDDIAAATVHGLVDLAPGCGFVLAATFSPVTGIRSVHLGGLAAEDARALFETGLGRHLHPNELGDADQLCVLAENFPGRILATAAIARSSGQSLDTLVETAWNTGTPSGLQPVGDDLLLIDLLAAIPDMVMHESWLATLADLPDVVVRLRRCVASGLVKEIPDTGYQLTMPRAATAEARAAVIEHAVQFTKSHRAQLRRPGPMIEALKKVQANCTQNGDWQAVLDIGAVLDPVYAQAGRWDAWRDVLAPMLTAARALGDRAAEARALHQLGTRELCILGTGAAGLLAVALRIRQMIGDSAGAAATQHNISLIPAMPTPSPDHGPTQPRRALRPRVVAAAGTALMTVATTTVAIVLTTAAPAVSFSPTSLVFPAQPVSTPGASLAASLVNTGEATAHITPPHTTGFNATDFDVTATTCGADLPAGQSCSTTVAFTPVAEGERRAVLTVDVSEGGSVTRAPLAGTGSSPVGITASPTVLEFPGQTVGTTSAVQTSTLTMPAASANQFGQLSVDGPTSGDYILVSDTCSGQAVPSGSTCTFGVQFIPTAPGTRTARLQIVATDGSITASVPLRGIGTAQTTYPIAVPITVPVPVPVPVPAPVPVPVRIAVPQVVGEQLARAHTLVTTAGLRVVDTVTEEPNDSVPAGVVLRSQPAPPAQVAPGTAVALVISSGPGACIVPDVKQRSIADARSIITRTCAAAVTITDQLSETVPKGTVIQSNPPAGATINKGGAVELMLSNGGVRVPDVSNKETQAYAIQAIKDAGLAVVTVLLTDEPSESSSFSTTPAAGTLVAPGSTVKLIVQDDPEPPPPPPPSEEPNG